MLLSVIR